MNQQGMNPNMGNLGPQRANNPNQMNNPNMNRHQGGNPYYDKPQNDYGME